MLILNKLILACIGMMSGLGKKLGQKKIHQEAKYVIYCCSICK